ncbi:MAG: OsmC family protein [Cytophagales bacterium]|nr:OsmC family protein [Cytophagales bacterium]
MSSFAVAITKDTYTTQVSTPDHMGLTDEPVELGGQNKGPSPYDLLMGALASCTSMTLRMYINRKGWDVKRIRVRVDYSRDYREDCASASGNMEKVDVFERKISFEGDLDGKKRSRLLEIANKCPVHLTLEGHAKIKTRLDA